MTLVISTLASIAIGHAMMRTPTELAGWVGIKDTRQLWEQLAPDSSEASELLIWQPPSETSGDVYASADNSRSFDFLLNEVEAYAVLKAGWDGEGSLGPSPEGLKGAEKFIECLPPGVPLPKAMVSSSGEMGFYWKSDSLYADVAIEGEDSYSLYVRSRKEQGKEMFLDDLPLDREGLEALKVAFSQV